jgi:phospholipase/lecithinase/hemolysin
MKPKAPILFATTLFLFSASSLHSATQFTAIHTFGDSLTDVGNTSAATGGLIPGPTYYNGRVSNGPVWVEGLAERLGLPAPAPSLSGGTGHAWAGASTGGAGGLVPTVQQQALSYVGSGGSFAPTELVVLWGGANDFFQGQTDPLVPVGNLTSTIGTLAAGGAQHILLMNLPDLGATPEMYETGDPLAMAGFTQLSLAFNMALAAAVPTLEAELGIEITLLDVFAISADLRTNAAAYGFTNTTHGALTSGNPELADEYLYWDGVHPTARVHDIFAEYAFTAIPEPSTSAMFCLFACGLMVRRSRSSRLAS